jgi:hypothetical protein
LYCFFIFLEMVGVHRYFFNDVDHILDSAFAEAEFLLVESSVFDAAYQIDDVVEKDFVAFGAESGEESWISDFGYPENIAELEGSHYGLHAGSEKIILHVVSICLRTDFSDVEDKLHRERAGF